MKKFDPTLVEHRPLDVEHLMKGLRYEGLPDPDPILCGASVFYNGVFFGHWFFVDAPELRGHGALLCSVCYVSGRWSLQVSSRAMAKAIEEAPTHLIFVQVEEKDRRTRLLCGMMGFKSLGVSDNSVVFLRRCP